MSNSRIDVPNDNNVCAHDVCQVPNTTHTPHDHQAEKPAVTLPHAFPELADAGEGSSIVLHWYDLTCPFCYLSQPYNAHLTAQGLTVIELPFQAHPDVPSDGLYIGPRNGSMYTHIEQRAAQAGMPIHWQDKLPNSRLALMAAEWVRQNQPDLFAKFHEALFTAHFAGRRDIGDRATLLAVASEHGVDPEGLQQTWSNGSGETALLHSEALARKAGVTGTPAWFMDGRLIQGLQ